MTVTVTPTVDLVNNPPRVSLAISANAGEGSATITRLDPSGATVPVRTPDGNPLPISAGSALLFDYEMPYGESVSYSSMASPNTISAGVRVTASRPWLVHPAIPARSVQIQAFRQGTGIKRTRGVRQSVLYPLGRANPLVITDGARHGVTSSLVLLSSSSAYTQAIEALTADGSPLLLNVPVALGFNLTTRYIAIADIDYAPVFDKVFETYFDITLPFVEVDRPAGGSTSQRNLTSLTTYPTIAALNAAYSSLAAVQAGP